MNCGNELAWNLLAWHCDLTYYLYYVEKIQLSGPNCLRDICKINWQCTAHMYIIPLHLYLLKMLFLDELWKWVNLKYYSPALWPYLMSLLYGRNSAFCIKVFHRYFKIKLAMYRSYIYYPPTPVFNENAFFGWIVEMSEHEI